MGMISMKKSTSYLASKEVGIGRGEHLGSEKNMVKRQPGICVGVN